MLHTKRFIALLLCSCMALFLLPATALADDPTVTVDGIVYTITNGSAVLTNGANFNGGDHLSIPATVQYDGQDYSVVEIGERAFYQSYAFTSVTIPATVTVIGDRAFHSCSRLMEVTLAPRSTEIRIPASAFAQCHSLGTITLGEGPQTIPSRLFSDQMELVTANLPSTLTSLGAAAFVNCWKLESVSLPSGLTSLGNFAFRSCTALKSIAIPAGVTAIPTECFQSCAALASVELPSGLTSIGHHAFNDCTLLTRLILPDGVTSIVADAFESAGGGSPVNITLAVRGSTVLTGTNSYQTGGTDVSADNISIDTIHLYPDAAITNKSGRTVRVVEVDAYGVPTGVEYDLPDSSTPVPDPTPTPAPVATATVRFESNGGSSIASITRTAGSIVTLAGYLPLREGFTFDGWYRDAELTQKVEELYLMTNTTLYAGWVDSLGVPTGAPDVPQTGGAELFLLPMLLAGIAAIGAVGKRKAK